MRTLSKSLMIAMATLFIAWLAAAPALASGVPGTETGKSRAAEKPLSFLGFPGEEEDADTPAAFSRLSLRLYGGYNHMIAGDVNEGSDLYFEILEAYEAEGFGTISGGYNPLHGGYNFGADLVYQLSRTVGIGLGIGYMRSSSDSLGTWTYETDEFTLTVAPTLSAMPVRLGLFLDIPVGGKLSLTANAGAAYYLGLKFRGTLSQENALGDWMRQTLEASERSGADIGFHGSLGFEYKLSPKLGLFVEGVGRYAKFKNFTTVTGLMEQSGGDPDTTEGKLYIVDNDFAGYDVSGFEISDTPPDPGDPVREPKFDLGGFSLQAGFRIRF